MESKTYSQRTDRLGDRPQIAVQNAVDTSGHVIITVGPHGGPFQTVYLDHAQAVMLAGSILHMAAEANDEAPLVIRKGQAPLAAYLDHVEDEDGTDAFARSLERRAERGSWFGHDDNEPF